MKTKILFPLFIIFFLLLFFVFYRGLNYTNIYTPKVNPNENIPLFNVKIFRTNQEVSSKEIFKGDNYFLLNIWSSWCVPCKDEHHFLVKLKNNKKIELVGLNYKDKENNAKKFLDELSNPYKKILSDLDGTIAIEWGAYGVPESFLIYKNKIIKKIIGPINEDLFLEIERLVR